MTVRKPAGVSWQSWVDRQIEEAHEDGAFDDLPGHGKPIQGIDQPRDELWWVRDKLRREGIEYLPPSLAIRKKAADAEERALRAPSESAARQILDEINAEIRQLNRLHAEGPPTTLMAFDVEEVLERRRRRPVDVEVDAAPGPVPDPPPAPPERPRQARRFRLRRGPGDG